MKSWLQTRFWCKMGPMPAPSKRLAWDFFTEDTSKILPNPQLKAAYKGSISVLKFLKKYIYKSHIFIQP